MQGTLFQLLDRDGEQVGLTWTPIEQGTSSFTTQFMEDIWTEFYNSFDTTFIDDFIEWINDKYPLLLLERAYTQELNPLK